MTKKSPITNTTILLTAVIGSLLVVAMVTGFSIWTSRQTISATDEAVYAVSEFYLGTMAERRAETVTNLIDNDFKQMEVAVDYIEEEGIGTLEELRETLGKMETLLSLNRFALVDEENIVYTQYTTYSGGSRHPFLVDERMEERVISTVALYGSAKQLCLAIPTEGLKILGKNFKACFIQIDMKDLTDLLAPDDRGRTYFALYSKSGVNLSGTLLGPAIGKLNFFDVTSELVSDIKWNEAVSNFEEGKKGSMEFSSGGLKETLCYAPIQGPGWELAVSIRESVIMDQIKSISEKNLETSRKQIIFTLVAVVLLATIILLELRAVSKAKLEAEKETSRTFHEMANTDTLTGVGNKHAYVEQEEALNKRIRNKEVQELALVVCDLNGLKYVNDTQGHAAGDQLIKDACALILECFPQGAVFRIGGDEFAVLLLGKGFDTMAESISAMERKSEENINGNGVVISAGGSILQEEDRELRDVFERADKSMYERKKKLKDMGAHTRD